MRKHNRPSGSRRGGAGCGYQGKHAHKQRRRTRLEVVLSHRCKELQNRVLELELCKRYLRTELKSFIISCKNPSSLEKGELAWNVQTAESLLEETDT